MRRSGMAEGEARMILNVKPKAPESEVLEVRAHTRARALVRRPPVRGVLSPALALARRLTSGSRR